jgi:non-homologous end joining protein Ku
VLGSDEVRAKRTHQEKKLMRESVDFFIQNSVKHFGLNRDEYSTNKGKMMNTKNCTTHHLACECIEEKRDAEIKGLIDLLRESLDLTKYAAAAYAWNENGSGSPDWFNGLREQLEELQPKLISVIEANDKDSA